MSSAGGYRISREAVGAFIDAVYAIALTILALEVPGDLNGHFSIDRFSTMLIEYSVAFAILFAFWIQHRRIAGVVENHTRLTLWPHAAVLLLVCIVPRATTLVFDLGGDVTLHDIRHSIVGDGGMNEAEIVDIFYVMLIVGTDVLLVLLMHLSCRNADPDEIAHIRTSKHASSVVLIGIVALSFLLPVQNRYFLLALPIALVFEREVVRLLHGRVHASDS